MGKIIDTLKGLIPSGGQLLNFGSSIASLIGRNKNIDKQINAQKEENQKNRDFNLMLAQMQNEWNQNQWERENEYNSPVNQMKRFKEAGLNPDLIYGQGTSGNAMQLSGGLTSGAPSSPTDFTALGQKMTLGDAIRSSLDTEMQQAQIDAIRANTKKTLSEAEGQTYSNEILKSDAKFRDAIHEGELKLQDVNIRLGESNIAKNDEEVKEIRKRCNKLVAETDVLYARVNEVRELIQKANAERVAQQLQNSVFSQRFAAEMRSLAAVAGLNEATARDIVYNMSAKYLNLKSATKLNESTIALNEKLGVKYDTETNRIDIDASNAKDAHEFNKTMSVANAVISAVSTVIQGVGMVYGAGVIGKSISGAKPSPPSTGSLGYPYN